MNSFWKWFKWIALASAAFNIVYQLMLDRHETIRILGLIGCVVTLIVVGVTLVVGDD